MVYLKNSNETITISAEGQVANWNSVFERAKELIINDELTAAAFSESLNELIIGGEKGVYFVDQSLFQINSSKTIELESEKIGVVTNKNKNKWVVFDADGHIITNYWGQDTILAITNNDQIWDVSFSQDERNLLLSCEDSNLYILNLDDPSEYQKINFGSPVKKTILIKNQRYIQTEQHIWRIKENFHSIEPKKIISIDNNNIITDMALGGNSTIIYTRQEGQCYKVDEEGTTVKSKSLFDYPYQIVTSPSQNYIALLSLEGNVFLMNTNLELIDKFSFPDYANTANSGFFNEAESDLFISSWAGLVAIWKTPSGIREHLEANSNSYYKLTKEEQLSYGLNE